VKLNVLKALYLHTPYCKTSCSYCVYDSNQAPKKEINEYFDIKLTSVIDSEEFKYLLENNTFEELYCGGGTPTIGSADQWRKIFDRFPLSKIKMLCTECSPITITPEHIKLWGDLKFTWVSMGVQSIHDNIVRKNNRLTLPILKISEHIGNMNELDIITNIDLICGLDTKTNADVEPFIEEVLIAMDLINPGSITIHVDMNIKRDMLTTIYKELMYRLKKIEGNRGYTCVNHNLVFTNEDVKLNSEFRFMRYKKDFLFRQISAAPTKLVKNWTTWFIDGGGFEQQTPEKEPIRDLVDTEQSYYSCKSYRQVLGLPFF